VKGTRACQEINGRVQAYEARRRGTRVIWRKLDCLNLNLQVTKSSVRRKDAWNRRPSCIGMALGSMLPPGWERCPARAFKEMSEAPTSRSTRMTRTNVGSPTGREQAGQCELCGSCGAVRVHHARSLADLATPGRPQPAWAQLMTARRRKTLVVCPSCHDVIHARQPTATPTQ